MILSTLIDSALGIQHILANGQYPEYLYCVDQATIAAHLQKCCQESITFINDQYNAIQGDYPILIAYDSKIHDLELELTANESQEVSSTSLAAAHQSFERIYHVKKYILAMMRSRSALLHQDVSIRQVLLQIETSIHKCAQEMMELQLRIKLTMGGMEDPSLRKRFYEAVSGLLPWNSMREQKRAELQQCRAARADMEKRLSYVKARLTDS